MLNLIEKALEQQKKEGKKIDSLEDEEVEEEKKVAEPIIEEIKDPNEKEFNEDNYFDNAYQNYSINIVEFAKEAWELYIYNVRKSTNESTVDIYELQSLLDVIGIKKNTIEIKMKLIILAQKKPKEYPSDKTFSFDNFIDVVESFRTYRIDDKLLVSAFQSMEVNYDGRIDEYNLYIINSKYSLGMTRDEIRDILNFFNETPVENPSLSFEEFCNLYYQG
jgi:Ca2+-binding EF-hand superfamily protein